MSSDFGPHSAGRSQVYLIVTLWAAERRQDPSVSLTRFNARAYAGGSPNNIPVVYFAVSHEIVEVDLSESNPSAEEPNACIEASVDTGMESKVDRPAQRG